MPPHSIQKRASLGIKPVIESRDQTKSADSSGSTKREPLYKIEKNRKKDPTEIKAEVFLPGVFNLNQIGLTVGKVANSKIFFYFSPLFCQILVKLVR